MDRQRNDTGWTPPRRDGTSPSLPSTVDGSRNRNLGSDRRRRAAIACRVCRARKVKCSNEKPSCAGCVRLGCECVYPKPPRNGLQPSNESNSEVIGLLHDILQRLPPAQKHEREASHALPVISLAFTAVDHVFGWPVFDANRSDDWAPFCVLAATKMQDFQHKASPAIGTQQLDWDEIPALLTKFLRMAHTMNPILDCTTLMRYGRAVAELGPQWDSRTCLVLVAAALGAISSPFSSFPDTVESLSSSSSQQGGTASRQKAQSYYEYARRRFGLLGISLTSCHCYFLSGVYLLYTLRPIEAWQAFSQASSQYTVYLKCLATRRVTQTTDPIDSDQIPDEHDCHDDLRHCLEQRLYWSCVKSENDMCSEVELPRSALHALNFPYQFPSPPTPKSVDGLDDRQYFDTSASSATTVSSVSSHTVDIPDFKEIHENSWFNYLSELSLSKLSVRVDQAFYSGPPSAWASMDILDMISTARTFEKQIEQWQETLPGTISCFNKPLNLPTVSEFQLAPWLRSANIKLRVYRPFLYLLAHGQDRDWSINESLTQLAEKAVLICLDPLFNLGLRHRHAGAWLRCRDTACRAMILVCAARIGLLSRMALEQQAQEALKICIAHMRYWEAEAEDIRVARQALERMI
ncbi:uncharacterized protein TrAFT101_000141 [Trichoderma asperellum]|uniref:Zn(2)-C6 fungal-type domain-containing protein n=2 Tax=Trichoderma asperellum TaxID=101201 RepID=A0A2T3YUI5_TRIA4|nr:hypothetical protein M441DRAFT_151695 [Trichoderma asperellum CBS 433.97]PTB36174.1 hypothetical protein M441DRAFT_151695 [Trichoderma asperellum CBS 433.97]UKZ84226.1 hypothetical protein TrAFT101_000141 [Trichoderma asperellum]